MNPIEAKIKAGATIVDVRTHDEFSDEAFPGAVNIPLNVLDARMVEIPKDKPVVVYCASGARSSMAQSKLRALGYDVTNAGGLYDMPGF